MNPNLQLLENNLVSEKPCLRIKLMFWLLLGVLSVILAEVVCFSSPFPFFDGWGLAVVLPLYGLHTLVLAWLVFRTKRLNLYSLFLAGALFGLYEAYITKVLWQPTWGDVQWQAGGIYLMQSAVLVFYWHPWMAFILPLGVGEALFTRSHYIWDCLPEVWQKRLSGKRAPWTAAVFAGVCGVVQGLNATAIWTSVLSILSSGLVLGGLSLIWRYAARGKQYTLRDLLPSGKEGGILAGLLLLFYLVFGALIRPEALPRNLGPHLTIWVLYGVFGGLLALNLKRAPALASSVVGKTEDLEQSNVGYSGFWKLALLFWGVFLLVSILASWIKPVDTLLVLLSWFGGVGLGIALVARSVFSLRKPPVGLGEPL